MRKCKASPIGSDRFSIEVDDDPQIHFENREALALAASLPELDREALLAFTSGKRTDPRYPTITQLARTRGLSPQRLAAMGMEALERLRRLCGNGDTS